MILKKALLAVLLLAVSCAASLAMNASQSPTKFAIPFAATAACGTPYTTNCYSALVPQSSQIGIVNCAASDTDGFPPLTVVPVNLGGCGPFIQDFNGILKQISQWSQWQAAGSSLTYDSGFSAVIGGYPKYAVLSVVASPGCFWVSLIDNNLSNPDTGGGNWANTCTPIVGGVLTGNLPNPGMSAGAAAANVGTLGGALGGTLPNPTLANSGVAPGTYTNPKITVNAGGIITNAVSQAIPTYTVLTSGTLGTYNPPAGCTRIVVQMEGGGGGAGGVNANGTNGGNTSFGTWAANGGGAGGQATNSGPGPGGGTGGTGGANGTGTLIIRSVGDSGNINIALVSSSVISFDAPSIGGISALLPPYGSGGDGRGGKTTSSGNTVTLASAGGAGEYVAFQVTSPTQTTYTVGAGGAGGSGGGGNGYGGLILITEFYGD